MMGAIAGDIIGSVYEAYPIKTKTFPLFIPECRFTDDTVLTVAVADCVLHGRDYVETFQEYVHRYPDAGFGGTFYKWALSRSRTPYNSWGNGSAMRVSPIGFAFESLSEVLAEAERTAAVTHNHPEGIKGAQAVAAAVFLARTGSSKSSIKQYIQKTFGYRLEASLSRIRPMYGFDVSCQGSVPQSIMAFLESKDYEDAIRNAISLGGDADTMACIAGAVAEAHYGGVPNDIRQQALSCLDGDLIAVMEEFYLRFSSGKSSDKSQT